MFDVIDSVLSEGHTSRLHTRLIREKRLAASVNTQSSFPGSRAPNLFVISATPLSPHTAREVETAIDQEIERLKQRPRSSRPERRVDNRSVSQGLASEQPASSVRDDEISGFGSQARWAGR